MLCWQQSADSWSLHREAPVGIEPTSSRFAVCRLTTWPRRRDPQVIGLTIVVQVFSLRPSIDAIMSPCFAKSANMARLPAGPERCRKKFLKFFPDGFGDETYIDGERDYKWEAHERWSTQLSQSEFRSLISSGDSAEVARRAVTIESRTNLLFSFEKMAMRDAVKSSQGARAFAEGL